MQDIIKQEQFEIEVLDKLNSKRFLNNLVFGGGSMLRLCFGLERFSADLDFWILKKIDTEKLFEDLKKWLSQFYTIRDAAQKFHTLLFEIRSANYPRSLKIEIRKELKKIKTEQAIAYSKYSSTQVLLNVVSLKDMMSEKIKACLARKEIRDVYDMEFLLKKGLEFNVPPESLVDILKVIDSLKKKDYSVKLGALLEEEQRKYYINENFKILRMAIADKTGKT